MPFFISIMHPEEIFDELEVLVDRLPFNLPHHEDGGVVDPFAWNSSVGEFNSFNLLQANDWIKLTDANVIINQWKELEYARRFNELSSRKAEVEAWQDGIEDLAQDIFDRYAKIAKLLHQELSNPIVFQISSWISEHIYIVGQVKGMEGDKLGIYIKSNFVYNP